MVVQQAQHAASSEIVLATPSASLTMSTMRIPHKFEDETPNCGEELAFEELFTAKPHVFLGKRHPLAKKRVVRPSDLDGYPYLTYEQGEENALYFAEEVMPAIDRKKNIRVRDRATMTKLILGLDGYTVSSGANSKMYSSDIVAIPLGIEDVIRVGIIHRQGISLSFAGTTFVRVIKSYAALRKNK